MTEHSFLYGTCHSTGTAWHRVHQPQSLVGGGDRQRPTASSVRAGQRRYGDLHAERNALKHCIEDPAGADIYVTLEPCCHHGKQPPCTEALVESGIRRVYIGSRDPNPLVSGKGVAFLREHGIEVFPDFLREK